MLMRPSIMMDLFYQIVEFGFLLKEGTDTYTHTHTHTLLTLTGSSVGRCLDIIQKWQVLDSNPTFSTHFH